MTDLYNSLREKLLYQETLDLDDEGVRDLLTDLLDRESMMKPEHERGHLFTCECGVYVGYLHDYCYSCGQKLDWED